MSIAFCEECEHVVEGETYTAIGDFGDMVEFCNFCKVQCTGLPEDDPREER